MHLSWCGIHVLQNNCWNSHHFNDENHDEIYIKGIVKGAHNNTQHENWPPPQKKQKTKKKQKTYSPIDCDGVHQTSAQRPTVPVPIVW